MAPMDDTAEELVFRALERGDTAEVHRLMAQVGGINTRLQSGATVLTLSVADHYGPGGAFERVKALLAFGARVAAENPRIPLGTSVHRAAQTCFEDALQELLSVDGKVALATFDDLSLSPLMWAVGEHKPECVALLLRAGAPVNARDEELGGKSPLIHAMLNGTPEIVEMLLEAGARILADGWFSRTAVDFALDDTEDIDARIRELVLKRRTSARPKN